LDTEFALPDFRTREKVLHLLGNLITRVQRQRARLVIQTYRPEEPVLDCCLQGDAEKFLKEELRLRKEAGFPPHRRLVLLKIRGEDRESVGKQAGAVCCAIEQQTKAIQPRVEVLGPVTMVEARRVGARILLKIPPTIMPAKLIPELKLPKVDLRIEVDPQEIF
jgi:primosomal protein N' (replication factor Y)